MVTKVASLIFYRELSLEDKARGMKLLLCIDVPIELLVLRSYKMFHVKSSRTKSNH